MGDDATQSSLASRCPPVSVVVPTRNRGDRVTAAVRSLLEADDREFRVIVVDQSDDRATSEALRPYRTASNLLYVRSATRGSATARNIGIEATQSEIIGLLDDDCEAGVGWVRRLLEAFEVDARIGIVFGNVEPGPHDSKAGFVPAYLRREPYLAKTIREKHLVEGMSACMGIRRSAWQALAGFDTLLGVGAPLESGAEGDIAMRALQAGYFVYETPSLALVHNGFRGWDDGRLLIRRYWYGTGAVFAKHLKTRARDTGPLLLRLAWRWAFSRSPVALSLGANPHRMLRLAAFVRGFAAGAVTRVDPVTGQYAPSGKESRWTGTRSWRHTTMRTPESTSEPTFSTDTTGRNRSLKSGY
ncbi:MAG TPA: glycosyltransferase family 2 protein [Candidatus Binatia bacterium]|nr:glycosyltransferase family 2 protein [Candidatus Binatia bacterium]